MYQRLPGWVLGFHGTAAETARKILNSQTTHLRPSRNDYDWLGSGIYFWENDPERARSFINEKMRREGDAREAAVIGAVIDLGFCMNLMDRPALLELRAAHDDLLRRYLDKAVFDHVHKLRDRGRLSPYQTVRSPFLEGKPLYANTFFRQKTHIQIAVRDPGACIKGYFLPRT